MTAPELVRTAASAGVRLWAAAGRLHYRSAGKLPAALRVLIDAHRVELVAYLTAVPCSGCRRPVDGQRICWWCHDRPCQRCGRYTGSAFIASCVACGLTAPTAHAGKDGAT
jgi:hypothetical protein